MTIYNKKRWQWAALFVLLLNSRYAGKLHQQQDRKGKKDKQQTTNRSDCAVGWAPLPA